MKKILTLAVTAVLTTGAFAQFPPVPAATLPTTTPTTNPADAAAVKDAITEYNKAVEAGNVDKIVKSISVNNETQKKAIALMSRLTTSSAALYDVVKSKFGEEKLKEENVDRAQFPSAFPPLPMDQFSVNVSGDTAALIAPDGSPIPLTLIKKDGSWKLEGLLPPFTEEQLSQQSGIIDAYINAFDKTAQDVNAGHIQAADEVVVLMQHRAQKAAQAIQMKQFEEQMKKAATQPAATAPSTDIPSDITAP